MAKATFELVAIDDRAHVVDGSELVRRQEPKVRGPATFFPTLAVTGADEEPVRPGVEARRIAELREVLPGREQRLLRRVLGEVHVAQDPARHGKKPIGDL